MADDDGTSREEWNARAADAESALIARYRGGFPGFAWARSAWPPIPRSARRTQGAGWHYWWSAHLVDAAIDAARHRPDPRRPKRARAFARGIRLRNGGWSRTFYDDIAWLGLALQRGADLVGHRRVAERIAARLESGFDPAVGAIPWEVGSRLFNAPANGPAAILFARTGRTASAVRLADWLDDTLREPASGLILDGIVVDGNVVDGKSTRAVTDLYTYCQGVALGAQIELVGYHDSTRVGGSERFASRAVALIAAIGAWTAPSLVLAGSGGGDGGLFAAIACRYLAGAAPVLEASADASADPVAMRRAAASARSIVLRSAEAAWAGRATIDGRPLFAPDWRRPADPAPGKPERDLSVQLGGWLVLEAAVDAASWD